jgi:Zn-dependent protease with chaperone function
MISIKGMWYDGKTSEAADVVLIVYDSGSVSIEREKNGEQLISQPRFDIEISPRLANTQRYLLFPGGEKFETSDNDAVDRVEAQFKKSSWLNLVHRLESRYPYVFLALALLLLFLWGSMSYGIPWAAKLIAHRLPPSILSYAGDQTLDILDRSVFEPSELDNDERSALMEHFHPIIGAHSHYGLEIVFRKGGPIGPNAFALPSGTIVFTDEMIQIAENNDELSAVLAHEIGHIVHRHSMRTLIQDSILGFILLAITGDVSGSSELFLGLPVLLTELAYSRKFELEADDYALSYMQANNIAPIHFVALMRRIDDQKPSGPVSGYEKWAGYLSTHPLTGDRLKAFEK